MIRCFFLIAICAVSLWPRAARADFVIGPYPVPYAVEDENFHLWGMLRFRPAVIGRDESVYVLHIDVFLEVTYLKEILKYKLRKKFSSNNCGRYSADNWVYNFNSVSYSLPSSTRLRTTVSGNIQTWTCLPGVPETVWDETGCEALNVTIGCFILRPGSPIKTMNFEQGFGITHNLDARVSKDGREVTLSQTQPVINADGPLGSIVTVWTFFTRTMPSMFSGTFSSDLLKVTLPADLPSFLEIKADRFGFLSEGPGTWLYLTTAISLSRNELNEYMRRRFPSTWEDLQGPVTKPPISKNELTDWIKEQCKGTGHTFEECAAMMGY